MKYLHRKFVEDFPLSEVLSKRVTSKQEVAHISIEQPPVNSIEGVCMLLKEYGFSVSEAAVMEE